jgi:putative Mn2+ efflux pump MntP
MTLTAHGWRCGESVQVGKILIAALVVGLLAFAVGFGFDEADTHLATATDALLAGIEAIVSSAITLLIGLASSAA